MRYLKGGKRRSMLRESECGGRVKTERERDMQKERNGVSGGCVQVKIKD